MRRREATGWPLLCARAVTFTVTLSSFCSTFSSATGGSTSSTRTTSNFSSSLFCSLAIAFSAFSTLPSSSALAITSGRRNLAPSRSIVSTVGICSGPLSIFQNTIRWRNLRKITIAQVHGPVFAAGLMLMWSCDLIVCSEEVVFADVVGTRLGMCGLEYFAHPWEFGPRKTKELLLTGDSLSVDEAHQLGMVSKVFPLEELPDRTLDFARRIAQLPTMAALLIKESVNQTVDNMGFYNSLNACFTLHELNHAHWAEVHGGGEGYPVALVEDGVADWRNAPPVRAASKSEP